MSIGLGIGIEALVAALLLITIGYCVVLNKRLMRLKADEQTLKATISELITATEIAERAVAGLKLAVQDCDQTLGERLRKAQGVSGDLTRQISNGELVIGKLAHIVTLARPLEPAPPSPSPAASDAYATVAAAHAFAARARLRTQGAAA